MLDYKDSINNPTRFVGITSVSPDQFYKILPRFTKSLKNLRLTSKYSKSIIITVRKPGGGRKSKALYSDAQKLFFILYYLKNYPTLESLASVFGFATSRAYYWTEHLIDVLDLCLDDQLKLKYITKHFSDGSKKTTAPSLKCFISDGTERSVNRPSKNQENHYSGKKNDILSKTLFI